MWRATLHARLRRFQFAFIPRPEPDVRGKCRLHLRRGMKRLVGEPVWMQLGDRSRTIWDFTFRIACLTLPYVPGAASFPRTGERRSFLWVVRKWFRCCRNISNKQRAISAWAEQIMRREISNYSARRVLNDLLFVITALQSGYYR